ncbi:MAG TPA: PQQ-binding-like beta-propeller repeat protein [Verrucomicrobiae bacterium]|nr:PQQ-binding-like beta-propeller repeat protein [Verrucomicrobiae bacterium]
MKDRHLTVLFLTKENSANAVAHCGLNLLAQAALLLMFVASVPAQDQNAANKDGDALYGKHCAGCHDTGISRAPSRAAMAHMSPENVRAALTTGAMSKQAAKLSAAEVDTLVHFLADQSQANAQQPEQKACPAETAPFADNQAHWNGWGADLTQHRFQPAEMARLRADDVAKLKLKWAFGFPGATQANAQPAVIGGRLFVGSAGRKVYSLGASDGCLHWEFEAIAPVRTAISVGSNGQNWFVYFGDQRANAYALDALTGKLLWKTHVEDHPAAVITGAPALAGGKLYVPASSAEELFGADSSYECCKFRGSISALDAATGKVVWKGYTIPEEPRPVRKNKQGVQLWGPSGAAVWSSPTVDLKNHAVYVTTGDSYSDPAAATSDAFLAFDSETGKLLWSRQMTGGDAYTMDCGGPPSMQGNCPEANGPDFDFGSSPILVNLSNGHRALIAGQKSGMVHAIDPDRKGEILWQRRVGKGGKLGGVQWGSAVDAKNVYVAVSDVEFHPAAAGTAGARKSVFGMSFQLDPKAGGGLFALNQETGEILWYTPHPGCGDKPGCSPAQSAAVTAIPGVVFSGGLDGHLRAYSAEDGRILWDIDTEREYSTVNGVKANGGSLDGPGSVVVGGMLYVNSGYAFVGGTLGNVLLAFSIDGK